jgi:branched-subunit amino acid aminotransferase/4-amino-4-deoxychorismate lyase
MIPRPYAYVNGRFIRQSRARIAIDDRGWRFGDGLFETITMDRGLPYQWQFHLDRLKAGMAALAIPEPPLDFAGIIKKLRQKNRQTEGFIRLSISRGVGSRGYRPHPQPLTPSVVIESLRAMSEPKAPYRLWVSSWQRILPTQLPGKYKLAQGLTSTLALLEAETHQAQEALLLNPRGEIAEAASANIFWLAGGRLYTPSLTTGCVNGSTRAAILRFCPLPVEEVAVPLETLATAEAVWLSNGRIGIHPVAEIMPLSYRYAPHTLTTELHQRFARDKTEYHFRNEEDWR